MNIILEVKKMLKMSLQNKKTVSTYSNSDLEAKGRHSMLLLSQEKRSGGRTWQKKQKQKYHRDRNNKNYQRDYYIVHEPGIKK